jgi:hypothetical protein
MIIDRGTRLLIRESRQRLEGFPAVDQESGWGHQDPSPGRLTIQPLVWPLAL